MWQRLSRRERTVIVTGATIAIVSLGAVYVALPAFDVWRERQERIAVYAEQFARLQGLLATQSATDSVLDALRAERSRAADRLLAGSTPALAASRLQQLVNRYAEESGVELDRVDVAGVGNAADDTLIAIPARLTGRADIYGFVDLLFYLQQGSTLLAIDDVRVTTGRTGGSPTQLLSWSIGLRGFCASPGAGS